jgi:hypothetical protein
MDVRLVDAADREVRLVDAYPRPTLRPRRIPYGGLSFYPSALDAAGVWVYRSTQVLVEAPEATVTLITADDRETHVRPEDLPADAVLWTVRDAQGRVVYRLLGPAA